MKNFILILALVLVLICCKKETNPVLETSLSSINFETTGGDQSFNVSSNLKWQISLSSGDWITVNPLTGSKNGVVHIVTKENNTVTKRNITLTITAESLTKNIIISQEEAPALITTNKSIENLSSSSGSFTLDVTTNGANWTTGGVPSWITLSPVNGTSSGQVTVSYQANTLAVTRNATITFTSGTSSKPLTVNQAAATAILNLDKNSENINSTSGSFSIEVTTNKSSWTTSGVPSWITLSPATGTSSGQVTVNYQANTLAVSRNATITFTSGTSSKTLTVTQAAASATISLDKTTENVNSTSGSFSIEVTTNGANWTTGGVPLWITLSPVNGTSSGQVTVSYQANSLAVSRNATITFTSGSSSKTLTIIQAAATAVLQINIAKKQVGYQAGSILVELTTNSAEWKITGLSTWISANPMQGDKSGTITLNYQANTLKEKRSAQIVFSAGNISQSLFIEQLTSIDANNGGSW
jgi:hypothetical protein